VFGFNLVLPYSSNCSRKADRHHMIDAFCSIKRVKAQELVLTKLLEHPLAEEEMIQRALASLVAMDTEPLEVV